MREGLGLAWPSLPAAEETSGVAQNQRPGCTRGRARSAFSRPLVRSRVRAGRSASLSKLRSIEGVLPMSLKDREFSFKRSLSAIEQRGTEGLLDRCRVLADQIDPDLRDQKPGHFVNIPSLADFQISLEHAASLLEENTEVHPQSTEPASLGADLQLPDPTSDPRP
jgi:hypothetical protein